MRHGNLRAPASPGFVEYARFGFGCPLIKGVGGRDCPSGFTVAALDDGVPGRTRLLISAALPKGVDSRLANWRILASTRNGRMLAPRAKSAASGTGSCSTALTFMCEFPAAARDIKELVIRLRKTDPAVM